MYRGGFNSLHTLHALHVVHDVDAIDEPLLALYVRAALHCVSDVVRVARGAEVAFEEDYIRVPPELSLDCGLTSAELMKQLAACEATLASRVKAGGDDGARAQSLKLRFALRRAFVELWQHAQRQPHKLEALRRLSASAVAAASKLVGQWVPNQCPAAMVEMRAASRDLGHVQPPRAVPVLDCAGMEAELTVLLGDLDAVCGVVQWGEHPTAEDIFSFLMVLTLRRPGVVARSCLRLWLSSDAGHMLGGRPALEVTDTMLLLYKCPSAYLKHASTLKHQFREAVQVVLAHTFQVMCMNAARQRRRLRGLMREGPPMTQVAVEMDGAVSSEPARRKFFRFFTAFQQLLNTLQALQMLRMGAMIALYETDELEAVYWYQNYLHHELDTWKEQLDAARQDKDKKKGKATASAAPVLKARAVSHHDLVRAAEAGLARGVYYTLGALRALGTFVAPVYELQPAQNRWNLRFGAMASSMAPPAVPYDRYRTALADDARLGAPALLAKAVEAYSVTKAKVEACMASRGKLATEPELAFLKALARTAVANTLYCQSASSKVAKGAAAPPPSALVVDWSVCAYYPCIKF